jgi:hypothetical protein
LPPAAYRISKGDIATRLLKNALRTLTKATGTAERNAAEEMIVRRSPGVRRLTLGGDKGYDAASFVADMRALNVTPHIAQNTSGRRSARRSDHAASRLCGEPAEEEARRGTDRLEQDDRRARAAHAPRRHGLAKAALR